MNQAIEAPSRLRLKVLPLLITVLMAVGIPFLAAACSVLAAHLARAPLVPGPTLPWLYTQHAFQLLFALIGIALLKRWVPADYGLHWPRERSYIGAAVLWMVFFGVLMTLIDYAPELLAHTRPVLNYPLMTHNVVGWLFFEGIYVGPTEEIPFRALLVTYLATTMPGRLRIGRFEMNWAGVLVALMFALLHASSFWSRSWPLALGQQLYAFVMGVFYAYWLEKSRSVVAPIIGHNISDGVEYVLLFIWVGLAN
jgi:hypothetical protein